MLSPGKFHLDVPTARLPNLIFRQRLLTAARDDRAVQVGLMEACRRDILFYLGAFVFQFNPLHPGREQGPFIPWASQGDALRKMIWCYENRKSAVMEKSREMGGTYLCILLLDWLCRFHDNKKCLVISRSADAVDKSGDTDAVFTKLDMIQQYLPDWMGAVRRRKMLYNYRETGSSIAGTASTGDAGVGGRAAIIFLDEFSQVKEDRKMRQRTAGTTDCRIFNGTHLGLDTEFFALSQQPEIEQIQLHWTQHPDKVKGLYEYDPERPGIPIIHDTAFEFPADYPYVLDGSPVGGPRPGVRSPWYDRKCADIGDSRGIAMDLDINPTGSVAQVYDALKIRTLISRHCCDPYWRGALKYDAETFEPIELIPDPAGRIMLWLKPKSATEVPPSRYVLGWDIATGGGQTPTCCSIIDSATGDKVGEMADPFIEPRPAAELAVALCRLFTDQTGTPAMLIWEGGGGPGNSFRKAVMETGFRRVYYRNDDFKLRNRISNEPGWIPTNENKNLVLIEYGADLFNGHVLNRSEAALKEMLMFTRDASGNIVHPHERITDDPGGARQNHGDRVIADAIAWFVAKGIGKTIVKEQKAEIPYGSLLWRRHQRQLAAAETDG